MQSALYELMLTTGSPLLEDLVLDDGQLLCELHAGERTTPVVTDSSRSRARSPTWACSMACHSLRNRRATSGSRAAVPASARSRAVAGLGGALVSELDTDSRQPRGSLLHVDQGGTLAGPEHPDRADPRLVDARARRGMGRRGRPDAGRGFSTRRTPSALRAPPGGPLRRAPRRTDQLPGHVLLRPAGVGVDRAAL